MSKNTQRKVSFEKEGYKDAYHRRPMMYDRRHPYFSHYKRGYRAGRQQRVEDDGRIKIDAYDVM